MRFTSSEWRASGLLNTAEDELLDLGVGTSMFSSLNAYSENVTK